MSPNIAFTNGGEVPQLCGAAFELRRLVSLSRNGESWEDFLWDRNSTNFPFSLQLQA